MNSAINRLPVPTWSWTGVNQAEDSAALPELAAREGSPLPYAGELPEGVELLSALPEAVASIPGGMGEAVDRFVFDHADTVCYVRAQGGNAAAPLTLTRTLSQKQSAAVTHWGISAGEGSALTVVQVLRGGADHGAAADLTQIDAGPGAVVRFIQIQLLESDSRSWSAVGARVAEGARVEVVRAVLGGGVAACGTRIQLEGQAAEYSLDTAYFGDGEQSLDFNDLVIHTGKDTHSELRTAGVLRDRSHKILRGTIDFRQGAVRAVGHEREAVLLLSPSARNRTAPLILCGEELVEGQHAATVGRFEEGQLYYLYSRGLSPAQAKHLMVEARFAPVLDQIPDEALRVEILENIGRRLGQP
ncbi:MAG: SufD family Fe-S cluster assembly protein [Oscillibacter sp.]|nr:SufD family Fe-S cluster assembly protein [Oscillibacter sp.]MEA4993767.1 SufD family Fe-S cluster assembly protein [Oscillibacter sp.]